MNWKPGKATSCAPRRGQISNRRPIRWMIGAGISRIQFVCLCAIVLTTTAATTTLAIESDNPSPIEGAKGELSQRSQQTTTSTNATTSNSSSQASSQTQSSAESQQTTIGTPSPSATLKRDLSAKLQLQTATPTSATTLASGGVGGSPGRRVCRVEDGESVAIMEIEESRGSDFGQVTSPLELPIGGSVALGEIELKIESETQKYFQLEGKQLRLVRPLDRDATPGKDPNAAREPPQPPITSIYLQISCLDKRNNQTAPQQQQQQAAHKKTIIPVLVKVLDLNDNAPQFSRPVLRVEVNELTPVGAIIVDQNVEWATDRDAASNGQIDYSLLGGSLAVEQDARTLSALAPSQRLVERSEPRRNNSTEVGIPATSTTSAPSTPTSGQPNKSATTTLSTPSDPPEHSTSGETPDEDGDEETHKISSSSRAPPSEPTINLNSEPILNGPMEDSESEEEDDETLLASMNANSNNSTDSDGDSEPVGDQSDFASASSALAPIYRSSPFKFASSKSSVVVNRRSGHHLDRARRQTAEGGERQQPPWTNLMSMPADEHSESGSRRAQLDLQDVHELDKDQDELKNPYASNDFFELEVSPLNNRPIIRLKRQLDYETKRLHRLTLVATDRALNKSERLSSRLTILIKVLDGDDQPPAFVLDQVGCATNSMLQTTSPLPPMAPRQADPTRIASNGSLFSANVHDLPQQEAGGESRLSSGSMRLGGFKVTDESFDFGDTLGLDDLPLDQHGHEGVRRQGGPNQRASSSKGPKGAPGDSSEVSDQTASPPVGSRLGDYSCLGSSSSSSPSPLSSSSARGAADSQQLAEYFASVVSGDSDYVLRVAPQSIKARDRDQLNAPIRYTFLNGTPANYSHYFQINPLDATIHQVAPVEHSQVSEFTLFVKAQEQLDNKLFSVAKLTIDVVPIERSPPELKPNSYVGFVDENSPLGTRVLLSAPTRTSNSSAQNQHQPVNHLRIAVVEGDERMTTQDHIDANKNASRQARYEFETTSDAFKVDRDGFVYVNRFPLDRDLPGQAVHMFQVTARKLGLVPSSSPMSSSSAASRSLSSPISLNITLGDLNDNPPKLLNTTSGAPLQLAANSRGGVQQLIQLEALDRDLPENSRAQFSIEHVSNSGAARFRVDPETGIIEALGRFQAGEQFSLTVQASDELGRSSQGILDVQVVPGFNSGGPQFVHVNAAGGGGGSDLNPAGSLLARSNSVGQRVSPPLSAAYYQVEVNEGVPVGSVVLQVRAQDPENDPVTYSLIEGNINNDFAINSKTGLVTVNNKLDREEISAYKLIVQARDSGGLATSKPIHVTITDANDQNPVFSQQHYVFMVEEGLPRAGDPAGHLLGRVSAQDSDEGKNGRLTYSLVPLDSPLAAATTRSIGSMDPAGSDLKTNQSVEQIFAIDQNTGDIKLMKALDYERVKWQTLMVEARDNGEMPRSSSAMVQVRVLDSPDEVPYFEQRLLEVRVDENRPNQRVACVQARDPDSMPDISYSLLSGDSSLFQVDSQTGCITTTSTGLDYETARLHSLLIGTSETTKVGGQLADLIQRLNEAIVNEAKQTNQPREPDHEPSDRHWPLVRVDVLVNDLNDNAPRFESGDGQQDLVLPIRVQDSAGLGSALPVEIKAHDRDGSPANNQIRYDLVTSTSTGTSSSHPTGQQQLVTSDKCAELFLIDATSGQLLVRSDLRRTTLSECQLVVRARDTPQNDETPLSSTVSLTVHIDHLVEISGLNSIGFADASHTVELAENTPANSLVKVLTVINKPRANEPAPPLSCEILSGNEQNRFYVIENEARDCELRTRDHLLDYEQTRRFTLKIKLNTVGGGGGGGSGGGLSNRLTVTQVRVNLLDKNDNRPGFTYAASRYSHLTQNKFLAAIAYDSPPETQLIQLRATDLDSAQANGLVSYELVNERELDGYFKVDPVDGIIRTSRPVEDLVPSRLPLKLRVLARDNPEQVAETLESVAEVVVNLIDDRSRLALVLKDTPASRVLDHREELLAILQERTGLISGLERVESLKLQKNLTTIEADLSGTDVWFYLIEPGSLRLIPSDDQRLKTSLFEKRAQNSLADILQQNLGFSRASIRLPHSLSSELHGGGSRSNLLFATIRAADSNERLGPALIVLSLVIALISVIVVIYQCGSVAGLAESHDNQQQYPAFAAAMAAAAANANGFAKDKFIFASPPPPPMGQFGEIIPNTPLDSLSRAYSTMNASSNPTDQYVLTRSSFRPPPGPESHVAYSDEDENNNNNNNNNNNSAQPATKRHLDNNNLTKLDQAGQQYETQMLKMSMLFDDSQSFDDQNLGVNRNLV